MEIREAVDADLKAVETLLEANGLPTEGVSASFSKFIVAVDDREIKGAVGLEEFGPYALLRSAVVAANSRDKGIGSDLVNHIVDRAVASGVKELYLLTTTAENYFPKFGFEYSSRDAVPPAVKQSAEFRGACPDTAVVMVRRTVFTELAPAVAGKRLPPVQKP
jgi:amino-acid N-acetyltransferase